MIKKIFVLFFMLMFLGQVSVFSEEKKEFSLKSLVFDQEGSFPYDYSCWVTQINPPLVIENPPPKTKSFVLTMHNATAPEGEWTHWVVYNIPPDKELIVSGEVPGKQALNDYGEFSYHAPCPSDEKPHRFVFELYALNQTLFNVEGSTRKDLLSSMRGKIIKKATLIGIYENPKW